MSVLLLAALLLLGPQAPARPGFRAAPPIFQQNCGTCHGNEGKQAPSITVADPPGGAVKDIVITIQNK